MSFEEAINLFYEREDYQKEFNYWEIDHAIATIQTFISDMESIKKEKGE